MQNIIKNTIGLKAVMLVLVGLMLSGCYATTNQVKKDMIVVGCLLYTSPSPRDCQ